MVTNSPTRRLQDKSGNQRIRVRFLSVPLIFLSLMSSGCSSAFPANSATEAESAIADNPLKATPNAVNFGSTTHIGVAQKTTVTFTNRSSSLLTIRSVRVLATQAFAVQNAKSVTLGPGQSTPIVLIFTPLAKGSYRGQLAVVSEVPRPDRGGPNTGEGKFFTTAIVSLSGMVTSVPTTPQISIAPGSVQVKAGQSQQFTAAVTGLASSNVTWSAALGKVSSSGLYSAPKVQTSTMDTVSATSVVSTSTSAAIQVKVVPAAVSTPAPAPAPAPAPTPTPAPAPAPPTPAPTAPVVGGLYVSPNGSDSNPGTQAEPWRTFERAIPALNPGATLVLEDGTYTASTTGLLTVNCNSGANNGATGAPITVIAQDERQATIQGNGNSGVSISNCSYWTVQGLYVTNTDVNLAPCDYSNIDVLSSDHINIIRNVVDHTNGYCNAHGIIFYQGNGYNLAQQNEIYDFHRHGILISESSNNRLALNYVNPRGRTDVSGCAGTACQGNGHFGFVVYPGANNLLENNISEGMQTIIPGDTSVGYDHEADYSPGNNHDNHWYGNISLNDEYAWRAAARCDNGEACTSDLQPLNDVITDFVAYQSQPNTVGTTYAIFPRSTYNTQFNHITQIGYGQSQGGSGTVGLVADYQCITSGGSSGPAGGGVYSVSAKNSLFENDGLGITVSPPGTCAGQAISYTSSFDHNAFYKDASLTSVANLTSPVNLAANELAGCVLWVAGSASSLKSVASDGGDIGASVLYQYENGELTSTPLWNANGQFAAAGASTPDGVNRVAGKSLFDVGTRLNVNQNACSFPSTYTPHP